jgi:hypothetical protein
LGLLYFLRPAYDLDLSTVESPLLEKMGLLTNKGQGQGLKAGDWVRARVAGNLLKPEERNKQGGREVLKGVKAQYYD